MFNCTKCGACCRLAPNELLKANGLPIAETGGCAHIKDDNTCGIYDNRPDICSVDKQAQKKGIEKEVYYKQTESACTELYNMITEVQKIE